MKIAKSILKYSKCCNKNIDVGILFAVQCFLNCFSFKNISFQSFNFEKEEVNNLNNNTYKTICNLFETT